MPEAPSLDQTESAGARKAVRTRLQEPRLQGRQEEIDRRVVAQRHPVEPGAQTRGGQPQHGPAPDQPGPVGDDPAAQEQEDQGQKGEVEEPAPPAVALADDREGHGVSGQRRRQGDPAEDRPVAGDLGDPHRAPESDGQDGGRLANVEDLHPAALRQGPPGEDPQVDPQQRQGQGLHGAGIESGGRVFGGPAGQDDQAQDDQVQDGGHGPALEVPVAGVGQQAGCRPQTQQQPGEEDVRSGGPDQGDGGQDGGQGEDPGQKAQGTAPGRKQPRGGHQGEVACPQRGRQDDPGGGGFQDQGIGDGGEGQAVGHGAGPVPAPGRAVDQPGQDQGIDARRS